MPAPLAPIPIKLASYGLIAAVAWTAARRRRPDGPHEVWRERAFDDVAEGLETDFNRQAGETRAGAAGRWRRTIRFAGRGVEIDIAALTRFRARRAD